MSDIDLTVPAFLDRGKRNEVAAFHPMATKAKDAQADAIIDFAKRVLDWPTLTQAIELKMEEQEEFVRWWRENVRRAGNPQLAQTGADCFSQDAAERFTGISHQQVSKWAKRLKERDKYREALYGAAYRKAMAERGQTEQRGASGTGENEWYTPPEYVQAARQVLGEIDLDPASSAGAQKVVRAGEFFCKSIDGLKQEWRGRVWLNPPFAQPLIAHFVSKMVQERQSGRVTGAIMLTHNYTDTAWFHEAAAAADAICFTRGRVKFYSPNGDIAAPTQGQAFFYFGDDVPGFAARFNKIGFVAAPYWGETE